MRTQFFSGVDLQFHDPAQYSETNSLAESPSGEAIRPGFALEGSDFPFLQHSGTAVLLDSTDQYSPHARSHGNNTGVVWYVRGIEVRELSAQFEAAGGRVKVAHGFVFRPVRLVIGNAATGMAETADADEHLGGMGLYGITV